MFKLFVLIFIDCPLFIRDDILISNLLDISVIKSFNDLFVSYCILFDVFTYLRSKFSIGSNICIVGIGSIIFSF